MRTRLILLFYGSWAFPSNVITAVAGWSIVRVSVETLPVLIFLKAVTLGIIYWVRREYGATTIYYFTNRGIVPKILWRCSLALDVILFLLCVTAALIYRLH